MRLTLGIETSCDETAAAVVDGNGRILSNVVYSQQRLHAPYRGVVPELASRAHADRILPVIRQAVRGIHAGSLRLVAYTGSPGLRGALLVGRTAAETFAWIHRLPVIEVNHLWGHVHSVLLRASGAPPFPFVCLIASGGHTELSIVRSPTERTVTGVTRDDAVGECFDKVARMLGLPYPGGPAIERRAARGDPAAVSFTRPYLLDSGDFSFSGLKTAVLRFVERHHGRRTARWVDDVCASFQAAVADTLVEKTFHEAARRRLRTVAVCGGVSANGYLRSRFISAGKRRGCAVYFPDTGMSTDNAAMIASAGAAFYRIAARRNRVHTG